MKFEEMQNLADHLDQIGAYRQANNITFIMSRIAEEKDHEHGMFRRQLDKVDEAIEKIRSYVGENEGDVKAWVQSLMTLGADYLDTVAHYLSSDSKDGDVNVDLDVAEDDSSSGERTSYASKKPKKNVKLNKPFRTPSGPKKFSVYVKNDKGNIVSAELLFNNQA